MVDKLEKKAAQLSKLIDSGKKFLITAHVNLDGDAIGSALALARMLKKRGKKARIVCDSAVPHIYMFLPDIEWIAHPPMYLDEKYDAIFFLDTGNRHRVGDVAKFLDGSTPEINIDHHASNRGFGAIDFLDYEASAVGEILAGLFGELGWEMDLECATQLFVAIYTDTGRFSFANTTPHALEVAAKLVAGGVNVEQIFQECYQKMPAGVAALLARVYNSIDFALDRRIAYIHIAKKDFEETGTSALDTQQFADIPRSIEGVEVSVYFREEGNDNYKVSFRANTGFDLNAFAAQFGGGGHPKAAGCTIHKGWPEVREVVINGLKERLEA
ncbi:MAG: bifunctional oligoribonuclease/PAP phosphatase NrnA [Planctomycetota bacterium]|nr:MAG: bifunctional oligoribonuclease/PAP phosphatase NrnA [Planctomycetota bacterium]